MKSLYDYGIYHLHDIDWDTDPEVVRLAWKEFLKAASSIPQVVNPYMEANFVDGLYFSKQAVFRHFCNSVHGGTYMPIKVYEALYGKPTSSDPRIEKVVIDEYFYMSKWLFDIFGIWVDD